MLVLVVCHLHSFAVNGGAFADSYNDDMDSIISISQAIQMK